MHFCLRIHLKWWMNPNLKLETRSNLLGSFKMEKKVEKTIFFFVLK